MRHECLMQRELSAATSVEKLLTITCRMIREVNIPFEIVLYVCSFLLSWSLRRYQNYSTRRPRRPQPHHHVPSRANHQLGHRLLTPLALQIPHSYLGLEFVNNPFVSASSFRESAQLRGPKISSPTRPSTTTTNNRSATPRTIQSHFGSRIISAISFNYTNQTT